MIRVLMRLSFLFLYSYRLAKRGSSEGEYLEESFVNLSRYCYSYQYGPFG